MILCFQAIQGHGNISDPITCITQLHPLWEDSEIFKLCQLQKAALGHWPNKTLANWIIIINSKILANLICKPQKFHIKGVVGVPRHCQVNCMEVLPWQQRGSVPCTCPLCEQIKEVYLTLCEGCVISIYTHCTHQQTYATKYVCTHTRTHKDTTLTHFLTYLICSFSY